MISITTVTNRNGNVSEYGFNSQFSVVARFQFTKGLRLGEPPGFTNTFVYNGDGELINRTNAEQDTVEYTFDSANPDRFQQGNLLQVLRLPGPRGATQPQLVTAYTYETNFNFVATARDARYNTTTHAYDERGNRTNTVHRIPGITEAWEYNAFGQVTAHVLPDNGSGARRRDTFSYYGSGPQTGYLQSQVVDSGGFNLMTTYEYDAVGNVIRSVDARGNDTLYTVNALNQVVRELSRAVQTINGPVRYQREWFYDANDNVVRVDVENRDENGVLEVVNPVFSTTHAYDILDDRLATTQEVDVASSVVTAWAYDANQNRAVVRYGEATAGRDPFNTVQTLDDERDLVFRVTRALGSAAQSTTQTDYDGNGNVVRVAEGIEDSGGHVTTSTYDGYDRRVTATDPMGNVATRHYNPNGGVVSVRIDGELTDLPGSAGNVRLSEMTYQYDPMDRRIRQDTAHFDTQTQSPIGDGWSTTQWVYSDNSHVLATVDDNNRTNQTAFDTANRPTQTTDANGNTTSQTRDANGNTIEMTDVSLYDSGRPPLTNVTRYAYDTMDRRVSMTNHLGKSERYTYDSRDNLQHATDARGNETRYSYDGLNRLIRTSYQMTDTGDGGGTKIGDIINWQSWDDDSRLVSQTDGNTNTTQYSYDPLNRRIRVTFADNTATTNTFDAHDNLLSVTDANGNQITYAFDLLNRATNASIVPGTEVATNLTFERYRYDGLSRLVRAENNDSMVTYNFNSLSAPTRKSLQVLPGGPTRAVTNNFDGVGNVLSRVYPGGRTVTCTYDPLNRKLVVADGGGLIASNAYLGTCSLERRDFGNGTRVDWSYDVLRRPTNSFHYRVAGGVPMDRRDYGWDAAHNKVITRDRLAMPPTVETNHHDSVNQLIYSQSPLLGALSYTLDAVGNRQFVSGGGGAYQMNPGTPEPADFQMNQYSSTPFGSRTYDRNGNLKSAGSLQLRFDARNRLVQAVVGGQTNSYKHDCFGRRIEKRVGSTVSRFYYSGWQEIEEQNASGSTVATYVWGRWMDELIQMARGAQKYCFHADNLGNIQKVTDSTGSVVEQYEYGDYGKPFFYNASGGVISGSSITNAYLFTGRYYDPETGLYYFRMRYLDPNAGRFVTRDPLGIWGDEENLGNTYNYVRNRPKARDDPMGLVCGSGITDKIVDDDPLGFHFTDACQYHDDCYETLGMSKSDCDKGFYKRMLDVCKNIPEDRPVAKMNCEKMAWYYYQAVNWGGYWAYWKAQTKAQKEAKEKRKAAEKAKAEAAGAKQIRIPAPQVFTPVGPAGFIPVRAAVQPAAGAACGCARAPL